VLQQVLQAQTKLQTDLAKDLEHLNVDVLYSNRMILWITNSWKRFVRIYRNAEHWRALRNLIA
jgi:hypothetical protein